jgi:hypothetical protein
MVSLTANLSNAEAHAPEGNVSFAGSEGLKTEGSW